ncbi:PorT family protein [Aggregatimonas sangjinii]|uniref:PorT family protein n=1 Tax=Aggregatimonas sangjinii TaxID=2583587 RepID=A0A5B7SWE7_9FLAO|nr:porin family protein [Aggregatimonas sangjinii]QCX01358.1 PorT family protein [Aggregatimonas sangjinii]
MKNSAKVLMVLMVVMASFSTQAQIFGVRGGIGLANITSPDPGDDALFGRALGVKIGGTIEFDLTDDFYLGSGLGFAKKGASSAAGNFNLFYLDLPVGARYEFFEVGGSGYFFATAGLNVGVLVSANLAGERLEIGNTAGNNFKSLDLGFHTGVGIIFNDSFEVGIGTEFGLFDISTTNTSNLKNLMLLATFGYKFGQ